MLLLHGFADTGELWDSTARALLEDAGVTGAAAAASPVIVGPDLPGAGLCLEAVAAGSASVSTTPASTTDLFYWLE